MQEKGSPLSNQFGTLYLCATPIGNLGDMTFRAVDTLKNVSLIAAEDTRHTRKLMSHFDIHVSLTSYHEHNKQSKGPLLVAKLLEGQDVAMVSDAGLPGISDPGADLVRLAIDAGVTVIPIPGASAALTALVASGLPTDGFLFAGFLPKETAARKSRLRQLQPCLDTLVFYESPHQLMKTLGDFLAVLGNRQAVIGRELTKIHEEFVRGSLAEISEHFRQNRPRGEFTVMIAGNTGETALQEIMTREPSDDELRQEVKRKIVSGENKKDAIKMTASQWGLSRRKVYQLMLDSD